MAAIIGIVLFITFLVLFVVTKDSSFLIASGLYFIALQIAITNVNSVPTHKFFKTNLEILKEQMQKANKKSE